MLCSCHLWNFIEIENGKDGLRNIADGRYSLTKDVLIKRHRENSGEHRTVRYSIEGKCFSGQIAPFIGNNHSVKEGDEIFAVDINRKLFAFMSY